MDVRTLAEKASIDGLSPPSYIKSFLAERAFILPRNIGDRQQIVSPIIGQAMLHEALRYLLRSMSQIASYEVICSRHQFSWALVTSYYSNYFSVLSMNRLAGSAISTANGHNYKISRTEVQSNFCVERTKVNNHKEIWQDNYNLYADFNWHDNLYDEIIIKVIRAANKDHYERKSREYINYHPDSYEELFNSRSTINEINSFWGKNYTNSPTTVDLLPFSKNKIEEMFAKLECRAIARQIIILTIFTEILKRLEPTSKNILMDYFNKFSKNVMTRPPFSSKLKPLFQDFFQNLTFKD
jgi:hypothetical protein